MKKIVWHLLALAFALARPTPSHASSVSEDPPKSFEETQSKEFEKIKEELATPLDPQETSKTDSDNREIGEQIRHAEWLTDTKPLLKGIKSFSVFVHLDGQENALSKEDLKTKVELNLRRNGIKIDNKDGEKTIRVSVSCAKGQSTNAYSIMIQVVDVLYGRHQNKFVRLIAPIWSDGTFGYAGRQVLRGAIMDAVVDVVESFSNAYLSQNSDMATPVKKIPEEPKPAAKKSAQKK
jgi:hypothetical protein